MRAAGEVVSREGLGNIGSFQECLRQADDRGWPDGDPVYFVEDDYLHVPSALQDLVEAVKERVAGASLLRALFRGGLAHGQPP